MVRGASAVAPARSWARRSMETYRIGFIPHATLSAWSQCLWDRVLPTLLKELGPLPDTAGGKNVYGQWSKSHPITISRMSDQGVHIVVISVPAAANGCLVGSDAKYEQYKASQRWFDRMEQLCKGWSKEGYLRAVSPDAVPL